MMLSVAPFAIDELVSQSVALGGRLAVNGQDNTIHGQGLLVLLFWRRSTKLTVQFWEVLAESFV
jgi:hypothetical protein